MIHVLGHQPTDQPAEPGYICTDKALAEGGYEPTWSFVAPPSEARLKAALAELLR
jgi:hypothetical protein